MTEIARRLSRSGFVWLTLDYEGPRKRYELRAPDGKHAADVWHNADNRCTWHTYDERGIGGENSREYSLTVAMWACESALLRAGWHIGPPETCICAAIRLPDGRIIRGHRHGDCIQTAAQLVDHRWRMKLEPGPWDAAMCRDQGFVSSRNRYVGREEGMRLQLAAGIESAAPGGYRGALFSEDLY